MNHVRSNAEPSQRQQQAVQDAASRVGDGSQLTAEDFPHLDATERQALYNANPDRYRALRDGTDGPWRPNRGQAGGAR